MGSPAARGRLHRCPGGCEPLRGAGRSASAFADVAGLWYRRRELEETGLGVPSTWGELRSRHERCSRTACLTRSSCPAAARGRDNGLLPDLVPRFERSRRARARSGEPRLAQGAGRPIPPQPRRRQRLMSADVVGYEWNRRYACSPRRPRSASAAATRRRRLPGRSAFRFASSGITSASRPSPGVEGRPRAGRGTMVYGIFRQAAQPALAMRLLEASSRRRPRPYRHGHGANTCPPVGCRARGAPAGIPEPDRRPPRPCGDAADRRLPARLGAAPGDARGGAHGRLGPRRRRADGGADRSDHGAAIVDGGGGHRRPPSSETVARG